MHSQATLCDATADLQRKAEIQGRGIRNLSADGSSCYLDIIHPMYDDKGANNHLALRNSAVSCLRQHLEIFAPFFCTTWNEYIERMAMPNNWGDLTLEY